MLTEVKTSVKSDFALIETSVNSSPYVSFNIRTMLSSLLTTLLSPCIFLRFLYPVRPPSHVIDG